MKQAANKDLRSAFATLPAAGAPNDDDGGDGEDDSDEEEDDDGGDTDDDGEDEQDDDTSGGDDKKPVEDPEKQRLSREAAKWRKKYREAQKALNGKNKDDDDKEGNAEQVAEALARANAAETRAALAELGSDLGITGEKNRKFVLRELKEYEADFIIDGTVDADELKAAIEQIVEDFPQVVVKATTEKEKDDDDGDDDGKQNGKRASGRQTNGKKKGDTGLDRETLAKKFPALRR